MKKVLVFSDIHCPYEDKRSLAAVESYMASQTWDNVIYIGDFLDFDCISSHNIDNLRATEGKTVQKDYDKANLILDRHQRILGRHPEIVLLEGNHEYRIERYIDANPTMRGSIEVDRGLHLADRGIRWVRSWSKGQVYRIGKAAFIHGMYVNEHHSKRHALAYGESVFYGHTHDVQSFSQTKYGENKTIVAQSLGCLCKYDQTYMLGRPSKWQQAFGVMYIGDGGYFNYFVPRIFDHKFIGPDGREYRG